MTHSGNAISYRKFVLTTQLTDKGAPINLLFLCMCVSVQVWLTFPKAQQIQAEQVPVDWLLENKDL